MGRAAGPDVSTESLDRYLFRRDDVAAEIFLEPSPEARFLMRQFPALFAPPDGQGNRVALAMRTIIVSPFTQLTLVSFALESFVFEVFHTSRTARVGHFVFMPAVNFFLLVGLAQFSLAPAPTAHEWTLFAPNAAALAGVALLGWYFVMAAEERLWAWWLAMVPVVTALVVGATALYGWTATLDPATRVWYAPTVGLVNPWLAAALSASMIMFSHIPEPKLPPRVSDPHRWTAIGEFVFGTADAPLPRPVVFRRVLKVCLPVLFGTFDELWASPRLMPYNLLMLMFRLGYAPTAFARLRGHVQRALESGNPAVDYVGIGGGTVLRAPEAR